MALQKAQTPDTNERGRSICEMDINMQIPPVRVLQGVAYKAIMAKLQPAAAVSNAVAVQRRWNLGFSWLNCNAEDVCLPADANQVYAPGRRFGSAPLSSAGFSNAPKSSRFCKPTCTFSAQG
jgi:hypothetical protein